MTKKYQPLKKKEQQDRHDSDEMLEDDEEYEEGMPSAPIRIETILLGIIALALVIQTFMMISGGNKSDDSAAVAGPGITQGAPVNQNAPITQQQPQQQQQQQQQQQPQQQINVQPQQQPQQQQPAQNDAPATAVTYSEMEVDFGTLNKTQKQKHTFKVTNTGSNPLQYGIVRGDAGANVLSYTQTPIPPGGTGEITVELDPASLSGETQLNVHVNANTEPSHQHLVVKANVTE